MAIDSSIRFNTVHSSKCVRSEVHKKTQGGAVSTSVLRGGLCSYISATLCHTFPFMHVSSVCFFRNALSIV